MNDIYDIDTCTIQNTIYLHQEQLIRYRDSMLHTLIETMNLVSSETTSLSKAVPVQNGIHQPKLDVTTTPSTPH